MENNFNGALESIAIIKKSINNGKVNLKVMYKLFLVSSIITILTFLLDEILFRIIYNRVEFDSYHHLFVPIFKIGIFIIEIIFFVYYIKLYKKEKYNSNKYYVNFLNLFGAINFAIPFITKLALSLINVFKEKTVYQYLEIMSSVNIMKVSMSILFIYLSLNILGDIVNKKGYKIISIVFLLVYILIFIFLGHIIQGDVYNEPMMGRNISLYAYSYNKVLGVIFSLIMPITLKIEARKNYGNK